MIRGDNMSVCSKFSMNSKKREVLRAVSINNEDHLFNLRDTEYNLKIQNQKLVMNFFEKMESA